MPLYKLDYKNCLEYIKLNHCDPNFVKFVELNKDRIFEECDINKSFNSYRDNYNIIIYDTLSYRSWYFLLGYTINVIEYNVINNIYNVIKSIYNKG